MKLAWIGGMDRAEEMYAQLARRAGHEIEFHTGRVGGRGTDNLRKLVERADLVVVVTALNSHGGVEVARRSARESSTPLVLFQRCGLARFRELLESIDRGMPVLQQAS